MHIPDLGRIYKESHTIGHTAEQPQETCRSQNFRILKKWNPVSADAFQKCLYDGECIPAVWINQPIDRYLTGNLGTECQMFPK